MKPFSRLALGLAAGIAATALSLTAGAAYTFTNLAYPGAVSTQVWGINNTFQVCGNASDGATPPTTTGFTYGLGSGAINVLPAPAGGSVSPVGINDTGLNAGGYTTPAGGDQGFIYDGSTYTLLTRPGGTATVARAINDAGNVTGYYDDGTGRLVGFLYTAASATYIDVGPAASLFTIAQGINTAGTIVGSASMPAGAVFPGSPSGQYGWVREAAGTLTLFRVNGNPSRGRGINDAGKIAGWFSDIAAGDIKGYTAAAPTGGGYVVLSVPAADIIAYPGAAQTFVEGINNAGFVSGSWRADATAGDFSGFYAAPPAADQLANLATTINGFGLPTGTATSLLAKVSAAQAALVAGNTTAACNNLRALINQATALSGRRLTYRQAEEIIAAATAARLTLGCA